jgi:hypothetical protein
LAIQPLDISMTPRILILCFVILGWACSTNAQTPQQFRAAVLPPDTRITLEESGLLITITADGRVALEGETGFEFDILGVKERISREELNELVLQFARIDYLSMNDSYDGQKDRCPVRGTNCSSIGVVTSFRFNGKSKRIIRTPACRDRDGLSYPPELIKLEKEIKDVVGLKRR